MRNTKCLGGEGWAENQVDRAYFVSVDLARWV